MRTSSNKTKSPSSHSPSYKTWLGNAPSLTIERAFPGSNAGVVYRDPVPRLTEGLNRKLYEPGATQFFSPQLSPKNFLSNSFALPQGEYPQMQDSRVNKFAYNDFKPEYAFPNTPFKQDMPPQYPPNQYEASPYRPSPYQDAPVQPNPPQNYRNQPQPQPMVPKYQPQQQMEQLEIAKQQFESTQQGFKKNQQAPAPEIMSPTFFARSASKKWPTMEDTAKMRNPLYSSHDFSNYEKMNGNAHYKPQGYNYAPAEPVNTKDYLKSHVADVAQAKNYEMEQRTRIHPQLGMVAAPENNNQKYSSRPYESPSKQQNASFDVSNSEAYQEVRNQHQNNKAQENRNIFAQQQQQQQPGVLYGINRQPIVMRPTVSPTVFQNEANRTYGQYARDVNTQVNYPW